jgi:hypothetical protein
MSSTDIDRMTEGELLEAQNLISAKLSEIINSANKEANDFLDKYGIETHIVFEIKKKNKG